MSFYELLLAFLKLALSLIALRCIVVYSYRLLLHPLRSYPGPFLAKFTDWYGAYYALQRRLHLKTYRDHSKYGRVIRQGPNKLVFNSVEALHDIYQNDRLSKAKSYLVSQVTSETFNLFNVMDKRTHRLRRRIIGEGITERAMRRFEPVINKHVGIFLKKIAESSQEERTVDMTTNCTHLGFDISGELGFGDSFELQTSDKNRWMLTGVALANYRINVYIQFPALKYCGWEKLFLPYLLPKVYRWHRLINGMIKARLKEKKDAKPDLFSSVSQFVDPETGKKLSKRDLFAESTFFIPAAGDTTSTLMAATFFYLSRYPNVYRELANEIRTTFTNASEIAAGPKLTGCTYLRAVLDETLRINPPTGTTLWRDVPTDSANPVIIDNQVIPPGTRVGVNIYTIHHNEEYFPSPFVFMPERWLPDRMQNQMTVEQMKAMQSAFTAFSTGTRGCAGKAVVYLEASLALAKTMWYFDFEQARDGFTGAMKGDSNVFYTEDQFGSRHRGPQLKFRPRKEVLNELYESD